MLTIKNKPNKLSYERTIEKKLKQYLWEYIYKYMFEIFNLKATNEINIIVEAIKKGVIYFDKEGFKATSGKFSNKISSELVKIGAIYDRFNKMYKIPSDKIPSEITDAIAWKMKENQIKINQLKDFINDIELNLDSIIENMIFDKEIITILDDVRGEITKEAKRITVIEPDLTNEQIKEIAKNYDNNMQYYIKNWATERISEMREKVRLAILDGYREEQVVKMLKNEYHIANDKAKFLARNETNIVTTEVKKAMYQAMGFTHFKWHTRMDGRERPLHRELNNTIWRFDEPPVIDERTGQKGLAGCTYNCRCTFTPIRYDSLFLTNEEKKQAVNLNGYYNLLKKFKEEKG